MFFKYTNRKFTGYFARRKKKLKSLLQFYKDKKHKSTESAQLVDESLSFSSIDNTKIETTKATSNLESLNKTVILAEEKEKPIVKKIDQNISQVSTPNTTAKPKRELPKTSALGNMFKEIHKEVVVEKDENKVELTAENVNSIWQDFLTENKSTLQNAFLSAAQSQVPVLNEDQLVFKASNNVSLEMLQLHKMDITTYFRKKTTSATVAPIFLLNRDESQVKNYKTTKDRLKDMIDENKSVLNLIEKLNLNLE